MSICTRAKGKVQICVANSNCNLLQGYPWDKWVSHCFLSLPLFFGLSLQRDFWVKPLPAPPVCTNQCEQVAIQVPYSDCADKRLQHKLGFPQRFIMIFCCGDRDVIHICNSAGVFKGGSGWVGHFCASVGNCSTTCIVGIGTCYWKGLRKCILIFLFLIKPATAA